MTDAPGPSPTDRPAHDALAVGRSYRVDRGSTRGVVLEVDASGSEGALAVLQAGLHDPPDGLRVVFGYELATTGLGAWVGDRRVRLTVWPAFYDEASGEVHDEGPGGDVLAVDLDPVADADALAAMAEVGRVFVASPDAGPRPLVLDVDPDLVARVLADATDP